jgi:hypothetical protein
MEYQMSAVHTQRIEHAGEVMRVSRNRVVEILGLVGTPEARHVRRQSTRERPGLHK